MLIFFIPVTKLQKACPDHIHMLVSIPPKYSVLQIKGYLKGKSSLMIFDRHANLKYKYGNRHFWARGYYVDTVGRNKKQIAEYIRDQLESEGGRSGLRFLVLPQNVPHQGVPGFFTAADIFKHGEIQHRRVNDVHNGEAP